jgi:DNA-directed RNA polymerase subunit RPC12/RpoP
MSRNPSIDYSCPHCGARQIYELVPMNADERDRPTHVVAREIPSIDLSCSRCGSSQTYMLVPMNIPEESRKSRTAER